MTFSPISYFLIYKDYKVFSEWSMKFDNLFLPKELAEEDEEKRFDLTSKVYIFMKRLGQRYQDIMLMDTEERDTLFDLELKLIEEERKQNEEASKKK